jgi:hypothetical protein
MDEIKAETLRSKLKPKLPIKPQTNFLDYQRLREVHPNVPVYPQGTHCKTVSGSEDRNRVFRWWFNNETGDGDRMGLKREDPSFDKHQNPLMVADTFLPMYTVEEMRLDDEKAKAKLTGGIVGSSQIRMKTMARIGSVLVIGGGLLVISYAFMKWKK